MQFNTRFNFNQTVFVPNRNQVLEGVITDVIANYDRFGQDVHYTIFFPCKNFYYTLIESQVFATKAEADAELNGNNHYGL